MLKMDNNQYTSQNDSYDTYDTSYDMSSANVSNDTSATQMPENQDSSQDFNWNSVDYGGHTVTDGLF